MRLHDLHCCFQSAANQCNPDVSNRTSGSRLRRGESVHRTPAVDGDSLSAHSDVSVADSGRGSHEDSSSSPCAGEADQSFTRGMLQLLNSY